MAFQKSHDMVVDILERTYDIRATESLEKGLFYLTDDENKSIGIMTVKNGKKSIAVLTKKQAYMLIKEFKDVCDLLWG